MSTPDLPPIPIPAAQRWREFRNRVVPLATFAATVLAIAVLWRQAVAPASLTGQVEPITLTIGSPERGIVASLAVVRFQAVKAGDPIASLRATDRREEFDFMQRQLDLLRVGSDPEMSARRMALDYQKLRLSWLQQKVDLSATEIKLQFAITELERAAKLYAEKAITEKAFDVNRRQKEAIEAEVKERTKLVADLSREIELLAVPTPSGIDDAAQKILRTQQEKMALIEKDLATQTLSAPIDGVITTVVRRAGEYVAPGEPVVLLTALHSEHIVGYLRAPFALEPQVGMAVQVEARSARREKGLGRITRLGLGFEPIANPELHPSPHPESGLPIEVSLPPGMDLRPGEIVSLTLQPRS